MRITELHFNGSVLAQNLPMNGCLDRIANQSGPTTLSYRYHVMVAGVSQVNTTTNTTVHPP